MGACVAENGEVMPTDPIETPEAFAERLEGPWVTHVTRAEIATAIRARDAALGAQCIERRDRDWILAMASALGTGSGYKVPIVPEAEPFRALFAAVRREALREAAEWLAQKANDVREVTRDCRMEAIALKAAGKNWKAAFDRECLSASRCSGFADAEEHFRALATGGQDDG